MSSALVIGAGRMARIRVAALLDHPGVDRCVVATRDVDRAEGLSELGVDVLAIDDPRLTDLTPGMVLVTSATASHAQDLRRALTFGCPILCEKPLAIDSADAAAIVEAANDAGVPLFAAFQMHFYDGIARLRERLQSGSLGVVYHLRFTHFDLAPGSRQFIASSGGMFKDLLVHDIECMLWLTRQRVASVVATGTVRKWSDYAEFDDIDTASVLLTLEDGLCVTINGTRHHPMTFDMRIEAVGSEEAVAVGLTRGTPIVSLDSPDLFDRASVQGFEEVTGDALRLETHAFADFALGSASRFAGAPASLALEAQLVADACQRSLAERRVIDVEHRSTSMG